MQAPESYVEVAVDIPSDRTFTYAVPEHERKNVCPGKRVLVPLGRRTLTGCIVAVSEKSVIEKTRSILRVLDEGPLFHAEDLRFYRWAAEYYLTPIGKALGEILPGGIDVEGQWWVIGGESPEIYAALSSRQKRIIELAGPRGVPLRKIEKGLGRKDLFRDLKNLEQAGLVRFEERIGVPAVKGRTERVVVRTDTPAGPLTPRQKEVLDDIEKRGGNAAWAELNAPRNLSPHLKALREKGLVRIEAIPVLRTAPLPEQTEPPVLLRLNLEQEAALDAIRQAIGSGRFTPFLLHGITGSGKTEVYIRAIDETLRRGGKVIYLVPEIALTPQLMNRLIARFPAEDIAVMHSGIGPSLRYDQWRKTVRGEAKIIVGARSAVFSPTGAVSLIIVDEEHDGSYKQDERMPYHARDLAILRAKLNRAVVILGSATPSLQTFHNTREREYGYLPLTRRVEDRPLPRVDIVDMKEERDADGRIRPLSRRLIEALGTTLQENKQALLFLNRRGFNTFHHCRDCAHVLRCLNCAVSLTLHRAEGVLRCHYCDFTVKSPPLCPSCGGSGIVSYGLGTERLAQDVQGLFPSARIARMDSDTTAARGSHERILASFGRGDIDILVGTQMITKGHDYPDVTLVGVISADTALNMPDFRAAEKTFQMLTQVAGRGGRGDSPGRVIIQTLNPAHYAIQRTAGYDYAGFYGLEIDLRRDLGYPPFSRMASLVISGTSQEAVIKGAENIGKLARRLAGAESKQAVVVSGPVEAPLSKVRGRYRWQLIVRAKQASVLHAFTRRLLETPVPGGCEVRADVDPVNFM